MTARKDMIKSLLQSLAPEAFMFRVPEKGAVSLTFDDGPDPAHTMALLDILQSHGVLCSFFLIGRAAEKHPEVVARIRDRGHTIGIHTYSHTPIDTMTHEQFKREVRMTQDIIERITGSRPRLLRPPQGRMSLKSLVWSIRSQLTIIHYTVTSNDWKARCASDVLGAVESAELSGGEIISFHDTVGYTVEAIPEILRNISSRDLAVAPIREGLAPAEE